MATFLLTYAFRCGTCNSTNDDRLVLVGDSRSGLEATMRRIHLGCKFCGSPTAVSNRMKMSLDEATPSAGAETGSRTVR